MYGHKSFFLTYRFFKLARGLEYLDPGTEAQKKKYAFKCHRLVFETGLDNN